MNTALIGTFKLVKYGYDFKNGKSFEPISAWYSGSIHYSQSGYMNVIVRFAEKPTALDEVVAYSGTYKVENDLIVHHVTASVRADYEGKTLNRSFRLEGDTLITEFENTPDFIKYARWEKQI